MSECMGHVRNKKIFDMPTHPKDQTTSHRRFALGNDILVINLAKHEFKANDEKFLL